MGRHTDERARVLGPYWVEVRQRWRLIVIHDPKAARPEDRSSTFHYRSEEEAREDRQRIEERICNVTVGMAISAYEQHLAEKETIGYSETLRRIRLFFPDHEMMLTRVTAEKGKKWYDTFRARKIRGNPISVSYHRAALINARSMLTYCVDEMKWLPENPFAKVKGLGKRKSGKRKPTGNELRAWFGFTWARMEAGDRTALGLMLAFAMSLRSSDLTRRVVRDVDMDGTQLNIEDGKTEKSNEPRTIPDKLQPFVRQYIDGRDPLEPLFMRRCKGKLLHLTRRWLEQGMERMCEGAGIPCFCPHSLKSASGTVLAKRGAAANVIVDHLSHEEGATTFRHYVDKSIVDGAQAEQAFKVISGGRK